MSSWKAEVIRLLGCSRAFTSTTKSCLHESGQTTEKSMKSLWNCINSIFSSTSSGVVCPNTPSGIKDACRYGWLQALATTTISITSRQWASEFLRFIAFLDLKLENQLKCISQIAPAKQNSVSQFDHDMRKFKTSHIWSAVGLSLGFSFLHARENKQL